MQRKQNKNKNKIVLSVQGLDHVWDEHFSVVRHVTETSNLCWYCVNFRIISSILNVYLTNVFMSTVLFPKSSYYNFNLTRVWPGFWDFLRMGLGTRSITEACYWLLLWYLVKMCQIKKYTRSIIRVILGYTTAGGRILCTPLGLIELKPNTCGFFHTTNSLLAILARLIITGLTFQEFC